MATFNFRVAPFNFPFKRDTKLNLFIKGDKASQTYILPKVINYFDHNLFFVGKSTLISNSYFHSQELNI